MSYRVIVEISEQEFRTLERSYAKPEDDDGWTLSTVEEAVTRRAFDQAKIQHGRVTRNAGYASFGDDDG